ncbi:hypothetical protein [Microlunatus sp. Y2014]|uniref:hypothetical protein n=1 Tax=Microlunatus sp. Y2014 TaxID=3418488 RepID=UPI003DA7378B
MSTQQPGAQQPPSDVNAANPENPMDVFRRLPIASVVVFGLVAVAGIVMFVINLGREVVAKCGSDVMTAGEMCTIRGRRSGTSTWTYPERLNYAEWTKTSLIVAGIVLFALAVIMIALLIHRWRRDIAVAETLAGEQAPLTSYVKATGLGSGFLGLVGCGLATVGTAVAVQGFGSKAPAFNVGIGVVMIVAGIASLYMGRPKGCTLVWAYPSVVRIVTRSTIHDVQWQDMHYISSLGNEPAVLLSWVGGKDLGIEDKEFFATMRRHINGAIQPGVQQKLAEGAEVDFRAIRITGDQLNLSGKKVAPADVAGIRMTQDKDKKVSFEFRNHQGRAVASIPALEVVNMDVALEVLAKRYNIGFLQG